MTSTTLAPPDHSSAAFTMWLLAAISQMSRMMPKMATGTPSTESCANRGHSQLERNSSGASTIWKPNTALVVCRVRSGRPATRSSTAYQA